LKKIKDGVGVGGSRSREHWRAHSLAGVAPQGLAGVSARAAAA